MGNNNFFGLSQKAYKNVAGEGSDLPLGSPILEGIKSTMFRA
jgi:hypothetical protein